MAGQTVWALRKRVTHFALLSPGDQVLLHVDNRLFDYCLERVDNAFALFEKGPSWSASEASSRAKVG